MAMILSSPRFGCGSGLKRELSFLLQGQPNTLSPRGRTRSLTLRPSPPDGKNLDRSDPGEAINPIAPSPQASIVKDESGVQAVIPSPHVSIAGDESGVQEVPGRRTTRSAMKVESTKMEMKMSKKISVRKAPISIRELLATDLLEGLRENYHCASYQGSNAINLFTGS